MAESTIRVEIGAWVEGTTAKKHGTGMRKVWVSPTPKGESARLSVIVGTAHVISLRVDSPENRQLAAEALALALANVPSEPAKAPPAPRKAPTPPKAPTPITRNPAPVSATVAANRAIAEQAARPLTGRTSSPAKSASGAGWFADLMAEAEGR